MKLLIFAGLLVSASGAYAEPLLSSKVKSGICAEAEYKLEEDFRFNSFDSKACLNGNFEVVKKLEDQQSGEVTLLKVEYKFKQKDMMVSGSADAVRSFRVDSNGQISKSWSVARVKLAVDDQRNLSSVYNSLLDDLDFGNGGGDIRNVGAAFTKADAIKDIEAALEDGEDCKYYTTTSTDSALYDLKYHAQDLAEFTKELNVQGKVKAVISRIYDDGESEYCSHYYFRILLEDGTYVELDLDFTT